ncbi:TPA: zinc ABC transporter substrate-binding protein [Pseudomonas aeruginosa]
MRTSTTALIASLFAGLVSSPAHAEVEVVTSIKPLQLIVSAIQNGARETRVLLPPGASPHSFSLRPSDLRALRSADLVYWIGPDLETFLQPALEGRTGRTVPVQDMEGLRIRHFGELTTGGMDEHAEEEDHDDLHRPGSIDAHLWLNPGNARVIASGVTADLIQLDPTEAARYKANLAAFNERLDKEDARLKSRLEAVKNRPFFVFHQAFDYFEDAYGLNHRGVLAIGTEVQPGARHVAEMRSRLQATGPVCLFNEPPVRPRLAETLSQGLPVRFAELDALGFDIQPGPDGYTKLIGKLGDDLASCLEAL